MLKHDQILIIIEQYPQTLYRSDLKRGDFNAASRKT